MPKRIKPCLVNASQYYIRDTLEDVKPYEYVHRYSGYSRRFNTLEEAEHWVRYG